MVGDRRRAGWRSCGLGSKGRRPRRAAAGTTRRDGRDEQRELFDKVKDFVTGHPEQADQGLDKAEEVLDERTGGQHSEQIAQGEGMVRERLGMPDGETTVPEPGDPPATPRRPHAHAGNRPRTADGADTDRAETTPPVPSPDPVPTSPPETVPEAAPDTTS